MQEWQKVDTINGHVIYHANFTGKDLWQVWRRQVNKLTWAGDYDTYDDAVAAIVILTL